MTFKQQIITLVPLAVIVAGLLGYNFLSAQWQSPTATAPNNNTEAPINVSANYQAKLGDLGAVRMRAGQYCNADGTICTSDLSGGGGSGSGYGTWRNFSSQRANNVWYRNNSQSPKAVAFGGNDNTSAWASVAGNDSDMVQIGTHAADSGQRTPGFFIIPPQHYYKWVGGINYVAEMIMGPDDGDYSPVYTWSVGAYSCNARMPMSCETTTGRNIRTVVCQNQFGATVADSNCPVPKPVTDGGACSRRGGGSDC